VKLDSITAYVIGDIALILIVSRLLGAAARRCGQPTVVGQILAGVILGPSLLGRLPGHLVGRLFPAQVVPYLSVLAQVAVVVFMFTVGYEIDLRSLRRRGRATPLVAAAALLIPLSLGSGIAVLGRPAFRQLGEPHPASHSFILFMGVATAITALPVLAAIARERGIAGTPGGMVATAAAGLMDVSAWLVLAAALAGAGHSAGRPWPVTLLLIAAFGVAMLLVIRPALGWWIRRPGSVLSSQVPMAFVLAIGSAWVTASLGLHPVFGGFLAGLTMPRRDGVPDADVLRSTEQASGLLLPLFFVVTGLSVNIAAMHGLAWAMLALIFVAAAGGKLLPGYAAARLGGLAPRQSAIAAALVNTRGLTELIALNVGLSYGIIHEQLFTLLVLMALLTTLIAGPLLHLIDRRRPDQALADDVQAPGVSADTN
jgi:K+:H+ antiporter